ncbi:MAG: hypothetical protein IT529_21830 [Burkholderiales bacterium]|nr:hypothetical protein [Burkholderiales bacterium]
MSQQSIQPGTGGAIQVDGDGRVEVTPATQDHPEGNRPRDAQGKPIDGLPGAGPAAQPDPDPAPGRLRARPRVVPDPKE